MNLVMSDGVLLQFAKPPASFASLHFAFLVDEDHFDRAIASLAESEIDYWADPQRLRRNEINSDEGRSLYIVDPGGHLVELLTHPYV